MKTNFNILICGVGGQGTILARKIACSAFFSEGYDVKASEVHGMAQRGGSVVTHLRVGSNIFSPLVEKGQADYILAFEPLEALRFLPYLKKGGQLIVNTQQVFPIPVLTGEAEYPPNILDRIKAIVPEAIEIDALQIACLAGNPKAVNVVLLGVLAKLLPVDKSSWLEALEQNVPTRYKELNLNAFESVYSIK